MIDFTGCPVNKFKGYDGANGNKINIEYNGESYMLKFPPVAKRNKEMSYANSCISEYVACHIFEMLGIEVQETLLGTYTDSRGKEKLVVACKDFAVHGKTLMSFAELKNTCIDSEQNGYSKDLSSILETIQEQVLIPSQELQAFFWDVFIADALLGNFDRHNGNWGILVNQDTQTAEIAPVYDCGSCLYPQLLESNMESVINSEDEINLRVYQFPASAIEHNGKKISYVEFIASGINEDCNKALNRIARRIDVDAICGFIDGVDVLSELQKDFYKVMISERYEKIIQHGLQQVFRPSQQMGQQFL